MSILIAILFAGSSASCAVPASEQKRQLALDYAAFDGAPRPFGWRVLNARGCTDAAVSLLQAYAGANNRRLQAPQRRELAFHVAQAYAFADRGREALPYFTEAASEGSSEEWRAYVAAHIAFFKKDRPALAQARQRYQAVSTPESLRLKFIDGLLKCLDKSYMQAIHCAM